MKEQTLQIVLRNKKDFDDIIKIRLVEPEYVKMNISKIIKKMTTNIYELKKIRLRNHNVVDILRVKKRKEKIIFVTKQGTFQVNLEKSKNYVLNNILQLFNIRNNCLYLKKEIETMKSGLIGVVINSELTIQKSDKVDNLYMNLIVLKGLRQKISLQGILFKESYNNIKVEFVSSLGVIVESDRKHLVFSNKSSKWKFLVNDKLTKNLSLIWVHLFGNRTE